VNPLRKHTQANAVRVVSGAALPKDGARAVAPNGAAYDQRFIASTELLASDGGIIRLDAWRLDGWLQRPRWIANHDLRADSGLGQATLGRGVYAAIEGGLDPARVGPTGRALVVYVRYASTPFAQEVKMLFEEGGLDDVSVRWDWQTEELRQPYAEEVGQYGEELTWVCTRADLVEISAVLLGADSGAQIIRPEALRAFERVRAQHPVPELEVFVRAHQPREAAPDPVAAADFVEQMIQGVTALAESNNDRDTVAHQAIVESLTGLENLAPDSGASAELIDALAAFHAALAVFTVAQKHGRTAINQMTSALSKMKTALGLGEMLVTLPDDRTVALELGAIAAGMKRTAHADADGALDKLFAIYQQGDS